MLMMRPESSAHKRREDLHVAREHHEVDAVLGQEFSELILGALLGGRATESDGSEPVARRQRGAVG